MQIRTNRMSVLICSSWRWFFRVPKHMFWLRYIFFKLRTFILGPIYTIFNNESNSIITILCPLSMKSRAFQQEWKSLFSMYGLNPIQTLTHVHSYSIINTTPLKNFILFTFYQYNSRNNKTNLLNFYIPFRETCKSQNINPIYLDP